MAAEDIPPEWKTRVLDLEDQVRGLREAFNNLYGLWRLAYSGVPNPDQYVRAPPSGGYTVADIEDRMASMALRPPLPVITESEEVMAARQQAAAALASAGAAEQDYTTSVVATDAPADTGIASKFTPEEVSKLPLYDYSPLEESASQVRFLAMKSSKNSTDDDPITCRLVTASLDDVPERRSFRPESAVELYNPLSYCWGEGEATKEIVIDGCLFRVRPSLYEALAYFRSADLTSSDNFWHGPENTDETFWWVDAICINQNDVEERKSQVALMSRLYRSAHTVRVWLGQEYDDSALAMDIVRKLAYRPDSNEESHSWSYSRANPGKTHRPGGPGRPMIEIKQSDAGPPISDAERAKNYEAIIKLFQRPWFRRVWVQQEAALPENVEVHCGQEACTWYDLMSTADILAYLVDECHLPALQTKSLRDEGEIFRSCFSMAHAIGKLRNEDIQEGKNYCTFEELVSKCRHCLATDPRDKVYALMSMINPDEFIVEADYTLDKQSVYKSVIMKLLEQGSLEFLDWCQDPTRSTGLPSWIPDLAAPWKPGPAGRNREDITYTCSDESTSVTAEIDYEYIESEDVLKLKGIIFDHVRLIENEDYIKPDSTNEEVLQVLHRWHKVDGDQRAELYQQVLPEGRRAREEQEAREEQMEDSDNDNGSFSWENYEDQPDEEIESHCTSIYGNIIHLDQDDWIDEVSGYMISYHLRREPWHDRAYSGYDDGQVDNDPVVRLFRRYLPIGEDTKIADFFNNKEQFYSWFRSVAVGRRFMTTRKAGNGLVPKVAEVGDALCYFAGWATPFVIREVEDEKWAVVGVAHYFDRIALHAMGLGLRPQMISLV